jgi:hypothetical protein
MTLTEDDELWIAMREFIEDEQCFQKIESDLAATFLEWREDGFTRTGMSTIIVGTRRACKALNMGLELEGWLLVMKTNGSEKKTNAAVGIGRYLTQKVIRSQKFEKLLKKEKHRATFTAVESNLMSNKMLTDAKITRSDALFRFTVAARVYVLPTPANIQ